MVFVRVGSAVETGQDVLGVYTVWKGTADGL